MNQQADALDALQEVCPAFKRPCLTFTQHLSCQGGANAPEPVQIDFGGFVQLDLRPASPGQQTAHQHGCCFQDQVMPLPVLVMAC